MHLIPSRPDRGDVVQSSERTAIVVHDSTGIIFERLRASPWGAALRQVRNGEAPADPEGAQLAVVAAYARIDWVVATRLLEHVPTVIVSARFDEVRAAQALSLGFAGYLDANLPAGALVRALVGVLNGEPAYSRTVLGRWLRVYRSVTRRAPARMILTPRQDEVLSLLAQGAADKEIATVLGISTATAQKHVANIRARLGVPNRAAAVALLGAQGAST